MKSRRHFMASSRAYFVFESAARTESFTEAAEELAVSQPAVSRQVRQLEDSLGCRLFQRHGNSVTLTEAGQLLYRATRKGLDDIWQASQDLYRLRETTSVTIRAPLELVSSFLIPALTEADDLQIDYKIELTTYRSPPIPERSGESSLSIVFGDGSWAGQKCLRIFDDALFPVCSPQAFDRLEGKLENAARCGEPFLKLTPHVDPMLDWERWRERLNMDFDGLLWRSYGDYEVMMKACRAGRGVAIGSLPIVAPDLVSGRLKRISDQLVTTKFGYYMTYDPMLGESKKFESIVASLKSQAEGHSRDLRRILDTTITSGPAGPPSRAAKAI